MRFDAAHDTLTHLGNRRSLTRALDRPSQADVAILVLDLNGFKAVNDVRGHAIGDQLLQSVADVIRANLRTGDEAFRLGGDEFAVVLADASPADATGVADRLRAAIAAVHVNGAQVSASIGIACSAQHGRDTAQLLQIADARMYERKRALAGHDAHRPERR